MDPILMHLAPEVVDCALRSCIYTTDDNQSPDFTARAGVTGTNCYPKVVEGALEQCGKTVHHHTAVMPKPLGAIREKLGEVLYTRLDPAVFYANSGFKAVETSIRLARMATRRPKNVVFRAGFPAHGVTGRETMARLERFEAVVDAVTGAVCARVRVQTS